MSSVFEFVGYLKGEKFVRVHCYVVADMGGELLAPGNEAWVAVRRISKFSDVVNHVGGVFIPSDEADSLFIFVLNEEVGDFF